MELNSRCCAASECNYSGSIGQLGFCSPYCMFLCTYVPKCPNIFLLHVDENVHFKTKRI